MQYLVIYLPELELGLDCIWDGYSKPKNGHRYTTTCSVKGAEKGTNAAITPCMEAPVVQPLTQPQQIRLTLPDFEADWQWPRRSNPHTADIRQESQNWINSFKAFSPRAQKAFDRCNFNLLTGLLYPKLKPEQLLLANQVMNLFFLFDEHSDKSSPSEVHEQVAIFLNAFHHPFEPRPTNEWCGGEAARQVWCHALSISTPTFQRRFLATWEEYLLGTAQQAEDRAEGVVRNLESYMALRRATIGVRSSFNLLELDKEIPDHVMGHIVIRELEALAIDLTIIANDVLSYPKEHAANDDLHNLITIVMRSGPMPLQDAVDFAGTLHSQMVARFNELLLEVPRFGGPVDLDVQIYVDGVAHWVGGNVHWSFESERYFGKAGLDVKHERAVFLVPRRRDLLEQPGGMVKRGSVVSQ